MLSNIAWTIGRVVAHRGGPISHALYSAANIYTRCYKNLNYDMKTNGELYLLDRLSSHNIMTVFDVGANRGDYAMACLSRFRDAEVHAFEIVPATFLKLQANLAPSTRAVLNGFGLSNSAETIEISYNPTHDGSSSLIEGTRSIHEAAWEKLKVQVRTGDEYCKDRGVRSIDLLKIDVEGAEHLVLEGLHETLGQARVSAIQFEYGMINIYSKFLLKDFWLLLTGYGFTLGPIMPTGVDFKNYDPRDEDFQGPPNFLAVHGNHPALIEAVRRR